MIDVTILSFFFSLQLICHYHEIPVNQRSFISAPKVSIKHNNVDTSMSNSLIKYVKSFSLIGIYCF